MHAVLQFKILTRTYTASIITMVQGKCLVNYCLSQSAILSKGWY